MDTITSIVAGTCVAVLIGMLGLYRLIHKVEQKVDSDLRNFQEKLDSYNRISKDIPEQVNRNQKKIEEIDSRLHDVEKYVDQKTLGGLYGP